MTDGPTDRESTTAEDLASAILGSLTAEEADVLRGEFIAIIEAVLDEQARRKVAATGGLVEPMVMTTVVVEFVTEWTDRGDNPWVRVRFPASHVEDDEGQVEVDVEPDLVLELVEERRYRRFR